MSERQIIKHTVVDDDGRRLPMSILPADDPKNSPLLVVFHGWTGGLNMARDFDTMISPAHTHEFPRDWTIVLPQDRYGYARCGCWWLGERGDFFMPRLLDSMISAISTSVGFNGDIHTFGTSMGGFGAVSHGLRWRARGICVNVPQIRLLGTGMDERLIRFVFGKENLERIQAGDEAPELASLVRHADATSFLDPSLSPAALPTFLIHQARHDITAFYAREQCFHLVNRLLEVDADFELHVAPEASHREYVGAVAAIRWFEANRDILANGIHNPLLSDETSANRDYASRVLERYAREHGL